MFYITQTLHFYILLSVLVFARLCCSSKNFLRDYRNVFISHLYVHVSFEWAVVCSIQSIKLKRTTPFGTCCSHHGGKTEMVEPRDTLEAFPHTTQKSFLLLLFWPKEIWPFRKKWNTIISWRKAASNWKINQNWECRFLHYNSG